MSMNSDAAAAAKAIHAHWMLFVVEGAVLVVLGVLAVIVPSISSATATNVLGWLFLVSGVVGLATTSWARGAPGWWWSIVSALLALVVGVVLIGNRSQDLYGGIVGWPLDKVGPLRNILVLFFLVEGAASIMFALAHRKEFSGRWAWMAASGIVDIVLACIILFNLPGTSAWTMGFLVGINMVLGGVAMLGMGLHARSESGG
jgi:uncharacterized membrane protein HdeD (DUF308 family)